MARFSNYDDEYGYDEDDFNSGHLDDEFSFDDDDDDFDSDRGGFGDDDEDVNLPYEGELFNEMLSKLHGTLIMYGEDDPALMDLQADLLKVDTDKGGADAGSDMFYLEEASQIAKVIKQHAAASPKIKEIYDNYMKDITRFSDETAEGHPGDYYLDEED